MKLQINGEQITLSKPLRTVQDVIDYYEIKNQVLIVEHNDRILDKDAHGETEVADGDKLELIQFVGGG